MPERQRANRRARKADDPVAQCAFVSKDGRRCEERRFLELHHEKPWIAGGGRTARNVSLRCAAHNRYEWKVWVAPIRAAQELMETRSGTS